MRALVMAAGLGTRLKPLTDNLPKPLVTVAGRPMIAYVLEQLAKQGISEALVNVHYLPEKMRAFVADWNARGAKPRLEIQDESSLLLGSGGAIARASGWLFEQESAALVCNADVLAAPDLRALQEAHQRSERAGVLATIMVMSHPEAGRKYNGLRVSGDRITAFEQPGKHLPGLFHFPGFYMVSAAAAARIPKGIACSVVEELWRPLAAEGKLGAFLYEGGYQDLGTPEDLEEAERLLAR
jgi:NDP-sugar pyrophosphorylase family protein